MACDLTTGVSLGCKEISGGVKEFYIATRGGVISKQSDGTISGITVTAGSTSWYKYEPRNATSTFTDNPMPSRENGTTYYAQTAAIVFNKMEQAKRNEILLLGKANLWIIAKLQDDTCWLLGEDNGMEMTESEVGPGTALGDRNGGTLNFEGSEPEPANQILYSAFSGDISATQI